MIILASQHNFVEGWWEQAGLGIVGWADEREAGLEHNRLTWCPTSIRGEEDGNWINIELSEISVADPSL